MDKTRRITTGAAKATATAPKVSKAEAKRLTGRKAKADSEEKAREAANLKGRLKDSLPAETGSNPHPQSQTDKSL